VAELLFIALLANVNATTTVMAQSKSEGVSGLPLRNNCRVCHAKCHHRLMTERR
jgi:hypothetical protein